MIIVLWAGIAATLGLLVLMGESIFGLHNKGVSHANVALWLFIPPVIAVGAMIHRRALASGRFGYGTSVATGLLATLGATCALLIVWTLFIEVLYPNYYHLMQTYAETQSRAQGHTGDRLGQELRVAHLIFNSPSFYLISCVVPLLAGSIASVIAGFGIRKNRGNT